MSEPIKRDNHFVPQMYLKNWAENGKVQVYRILVRHENVPLWKGFHLKGIGYFRHLYVDTFHGLECDKLETWFDEKYESPAEASISKVLSNTKLTKTDYTNLIRFLALQDLRTPKKFIEHLSKNNEDDFSSMFQKVVDGIASKGIPTNFVPSGELKFHDEFPLKLRITEQEGSLAVEVEKLIGRASWLWSIKHLLNHVEGRLHENKWTILNPAKDLSWYTSDNPVLKLNYNDENNYDFKGGWASSGSELILPLGPQHLLYARVGSVSPLMSSTKLSEKETTRLNRMIIENSHRYAIFSEQDDDISNYHQRSVSSEQVAYELEQWNNLHESQLNAEKDFYLVK